MYQHILVPTDGSVTSDKALSEAIALARLSGGSIRLLHIVDALTVAAVADGLASYTDTLLPLLREGGQQILDDAQQRVKAAGVCVDATLREVVAGRVCDLVLEAATAWPADLIVIGTHGRRGVQRLLLGSDAEQILRAATVPVLLVRGG